MRKQGLVHLHALCREVRTHVEVREDVPPGAFDRYEEVGVSPSAIYRRKQSHRRSVQTLLDGIVTAVDADGPTASEPAATDGGTETDPPGE